MTSEVDIYVCSACGDTFESTRSDEEAAAEAVALFPDVPLADMEVICDDCYQQMVREELFPA